MGCQVSVERLPFDVQLRLQLTEKQIELVKETWPLLTPELNAAGLQLFLKLFETSPELKPLFLGNMPVTGNRAEDMDAQHERLKAHALTFMTALGSCVENLSDTQQLAHTLTVLGAGHVQSKVNPNALKKLWPALDSVLRDRLASRYTQDVREAWKTVLDFITSKMAEGMIKVMQENAYHKSRRARLAANGDTSTSGTATTTTNSPTPSLSPRRTPRFSSRLS